MVDCSFQGCDDLRFPVCSLFPDDFVEILSKFKIVEIDNIIQNCSPSFAPLIQVKRLQSLRDCFPWAPAPIKSRQLEEDGEEAVL